MNLEEAIKVLKDFLANPEGYNCPDCTCGCQEELKNALNSAVFKLERLEETKKWLKAESDLYRSSAKDCENKNIVTHGRYVLMVDKLEEVLARLEGEEK